MMANKLTFIVKNIKVQRKKKQRKRNNLKKLTCNQFPLQLTVKRQKRK